MSSSTSPVTASGGSTENPLLALTKLILKSEHKSDLILRCQGRDFKVHQNFVCTQSKPLAAAMNGHFKESGTGVIELIDDEPEIVEKMIEFLYTAAYTRIEQSPPLEGDLSLVKRTRSKNLLKSAKLYVMGDKYDIPAPKSFSLDDFESNTMDGWSFDLLLEILALIYTQLPESDTVLKCLAVKYLCTGKKCFDVVLRSSEFAKLCNEIGQVGLDVARECRRIAKEEKNVSKEEVNEKFWYNPHPDRYYLYDPDCRNSQS